MLVFREIGRWEWGVFSILSGKEYVDADGSQSTHPWGYASQPGEERLVLSRTPSAEATDDQQDIYAVLNRVKRTIDENSEATAGSPWTMAVQRDTPSLVKSPVPLWFMPE